MNEIRLSVALVTRNRPQWLRKCLTSWRSQATQPFEIVVSDDSYPEFNDEVKQIASEFNCRYVKGPRRGLYANRNSAALACRGSHIMSADDDHTHSADFLCALIRTIQTDPDAIWTVGERVPGRPDMQTGMPGELRPDGTIGPPADPTQSAAIACGSTVYPSRVFSLGYRCDETYPFGGLWYLWGHRLRKAGFRIRQCQDTFVWHHADSSISRRDDLKFVSAQLECNLYVQAVHAFRVSHNPRALLHTLKNALLLMTIGGKVHSQGRKVRIRPANILRAFSSAARWGW